VSFPVAFGRLKLSEIIREFLDAYPKLKVEANYTDRFVDLIEEPYAPWCGSEACRTRR
jgi:DNA-binding transcriptional LysR family regulator